MKSIFLEKENYLFPFFYPTPLGVPAGIATQDSRKDTMGLAEKASRDQR